MNDTQERIEQIIDRYNEQIFHYERGTIGYLMLNRMGQDLRNLLENEHI